VKLSKGITGVLALAATAAFASALSAQTLQVLTAGSSAQFGPFAVAAYQLAQTGTPTAYGHYTLKDGTCTDSGNGTPSTTLSPKCYAYIYDQRNNTYSGTTYDIAPENGNLWIVWNNTGTVSSPVYNVWAYMSVDSTVGVRAFQAVPRAELAFISTTLPAVAANYPLFWYDSTADQIPPSAIVTALNNATFTAANTDIRPEDALFATNRTLNHGSGTYQTNLGWGTVQNSAGQYVEGTAIDSYFGSGVAHPVSFSVSGTDPFSGSNVVPFVTVPIGAAPVVFLVNSNLTTAKNITSTNAGILFSGSTPSGGSPCQGSLLDGVTSGYLSPILREPLSGTMNTTEYSVFSPNSYDQESGWTVGNTSETCGTAGGGRYRAIGTGDEVNAVRNSGTTTVTNPVGYSFFSYESTGASSTYGYVTLNGYDPIGSASTGTGPIALPSCTLSSSVYSCSKTPGTSFPNLRSGNYAAWSVYRIVTDSTGLTNATALVAAADKYVNANIPDFVPFSPVCRLTAAGKDEPGLDVYREHYTPSGITLPTPTSPQATGPDDGPQQTAVSCTTGGSHTLHYLTLGGQDSANANTEYGGDVGGTIQGPFTSSSQPTAPGLTQSSNH
jgi:hypothetical protein